MRPETAEYLDKAREFLKKSRDMLASWPDEAGRAAYFAAFYAAQALIFEKCEKTPEKHAGVQPQVARLFKAGGALDEDLRRSLGRAFRMKTVARH